MFRLAAALGGLGILTTVAELTPPGLREASIEWEGVDRPVTTPRPMVATLEIRNPRSGSRFPAGKTINIDAVAIDPAGYISRVEFMDGDRSLGFSEIVFIRAPDPGTPIDHTFEWERASVGDHAIWTRAVDSAGNEVSSGRVVVTVVGEPPVREQVVLSLESRDREASEPVPGKDADVGVMIVRRVGGTRDVAVPIFLAWGGTAVPGVDFAKPADPLVLPPGADSLEIVIRPLPDDRTEGTERVEARLVSPVCPLIYPAPPQCYHIAEPSVAWVEIQDAAGNGNVSPRVAIVRPRNGTVFTSGDRIDIEAIADDPDGAIARLDILVGDRVLGSTRGGELTVEWGDAPVGLHVLTAKAQDDGGREAVSSPVKVYVRDVAELAFVRRELPPAYLAGNTIEVLLAAEPPRGAGAWTVEDVPPVGWPVTEASDEGGYDAARGKVKFGPFLDGSPKRLSYRVTAPQDATGRQTFAGTASLNGKSYPVVGEGVLGPAGEYHPADAAPRDGAIVADELTAYAAAWRSRKAWADDTGAIPLGYVTRAGQIWRQGEAYRFEAAAGAPPACWVPESSPPPPPTPALAGGSAATASSGAAERFAPTLWKAGEAGTVRIEVTPPSGAAATAVEEGVPAGWRVKSVDNGGVWDVTAGRIRWGILYGDGAKEVSYELLAPGAGSSICRLEGIVSFDGREVSIGGLHHAGSSDLGTALRIAGWRRGTNGRVHLNVEASTDQVFAVDASSDLAHWIEVRAFVYTGDELAVDDPDAAAGIAHRYYRLRPVGR